MSSRGRAAAGFPELEPSGLLHAATTTIPDMAVTIEIRIQGTPMARYDAHEQFI